MADTLPNFYSDQSPIGAALSNLSRIITNGPTEAQRIAQAEAALKLQQQRQGRQSVADAFGQFGGPGFDRNAAMRSAVTAGMNPQHLAELERYGAAGKYGATDPRTAGAFVGAGGSYGSTGAGFREDQARQFAQSQATIAENARQFDSTPVVTTTPDNVPVYARRADAYGQPSQALFDANREFTKQGMITDRTNAAADRRDASNLVGVKGPDGKVVLVPRSQAAGMQPAPTPDSVRAGAMESTLPTLNPTEAKQFIGANPPQPQQPFNYMAPDGKKYLTRDGVTDVQSGQPLPPGGARIAIEGTPDQAGLSASNTSKLQEANVANQRVTAVLGRARELSQDPNNFGLSGWVKGGAQNAFAAASNLAQGLGYQGIQQAAVDFRNKAIAGGVNPSLISGMFDPNLPALHTVSDMLVFSAAEALAGQSGRSMSDKDVRLFKTIVGDPTAWMMTKEAYLAKLDEVEHILASYQAINNRVLGDKAGTTTPPAAPAAPGAPGAPMQITPPAGGSKRFERGPDGQLRRVQ